MNLIHLETSSNPLSIKGHANQLVQYVIAALFRINVYILLFSTQMFNSVMISVHPKHLVMMNVP